ncbi:energy transducer TonB family protein [Nostoc sp.]|uniref:energy transducer TonB family protein n=1 Tax=Nostoc sp. TaxID=1180 RepID=UPI002FF53806
MLVGLVSSILLHCTLLIGSKYWLTAFTPEPKQEIPIEVVEVYPNETHIPQKTPFRATKDSIAGGKALPKKPVSAVKSANSDAHKSSSKSPFDSTALSSAEVFRPEPRQQKAESPNLSPQQPEVEPTTSATAIPPAPKVQPTAIARAIPLAPKVQPTAIAKATIPPVPKVEPTAIARAIAPAPKVQPTAIAKAIPPAPKVQPTAIARAIPLAPKVQPTVIAKAIPPAPKVQPRTIPLAPKVQPTAIARAIPLVPKVQPTAIARAIPLVPKVQPTAIARAIPPAPKVQPRAITRAIPPAPKVQPTAIARAIPPAPKPKKIAVAPKTTPPSALPRKTALAPAIASPVPNPKNLGQSRRTSSGRTAIAHSSQKKGAASLLGGTLSVSSRNFSGNLAALPNSNRDNQARSSIDASSQDIDITSYLNQLQQQVKQQWLPEVSQSSRRTVLNFTINRSGQVSNLQLAQTSGFGVTDQAALNAIQRSAPFAPLPTGYTSNHIHIQFTFDINVYGQLDLSGNGG